MKTGKNYKFWFATGSQDLYGDECLRNVAEHSKKCDGVLSYQSVPFWRQHEQCCRYRGGQGRGSN